MKAALWQHAWRENWPLGLGLSALLMAYHLLFVWMVSLVDLGYLGMFLKFGLRLPLQDLFPIPLDEVATPRGMLSMAWIDAVPVLLVSAWAVARGSDAVSGPLDRGELEWLLTAGVSRSGFLTAQVAVAGLWSVLLAFSGWIGTWLGLLWIDLGEPVSSTRFLPAVVNTWGTMFFLYGFTVLVSAWGRYRRYTIGLVGAVYAVELILKVVARMSPWKWLAGLTFFGAFEPAWLVHQDQPWWECFKYTAPLVAGAAVFLAASFLVFKRRDLPAVV